jgi:membrane protease YdiL (CAAX protease family)
MSSSYTIDSSSAPWPRRLIRSAPMRIFGGALAVVLPVALTMATIQHALDKPHRQVWPHLLAASLCLLAYCAFVRFTERRPISELKTRTALPEALVGTLIGAMLVCIVCATLAAIGYLEITGRGSGNLINPLAEMALAAVFEEVLFRAVLFRMLVAWLGMRSAFVASSVLFGLAHLPNNGFSLLPFLAVTAAGMLLAAAYLVHERLWLPIGLHFGWNYTVDGVFGLSSSGQNAHGYLESQVSGPQWLSGGTFGVEASIVTLLVTTGATAVLLALRSRLRKRDPLIS